MNSLFLITSYIILFELWKEKLDVDKLPGAERVNVKQQQKFIKMLNLKTCADYFHIFLIK